MIFRTEASIPRSASFDISFIALLTVVAFQTIVEQALPAIPDLTLMAGFLAINYVLLAATIVINLRVDQLDRAGRSAEDDDADETSPADDRAGASGLGAAG